MVSGDNSGHYHELNQLAERNLDNSVMLFGMNARKKISLCTQHKLKASILFVFGSPTMLHMPLHS